MLTKTAVSIHIFPQFGMKPGNDRLPDEMILGDGGADGNGRIIAVRRYSLGIGSVALPV